jgi:hypothetical protein
MPNHCCNTLKIAVDAMPVILKNYIARTNRGKKFLTLNGLNPSATYPTGTNNEMKNGVRNGPVMI